jgi:hypothetical protein
MQAMNAIKTRPGHVPVQSHRVAIDFLLLAAAAIMAGLVTAAVAAALVILLSASANAATQTRDDARLSWDTASPARSSGPCRESIRNRLPHNR